MSPLGVTWGNSPTPFCRRLLLQVLKQPGMLHLRWSRTGNTGPIQQSVPQQHLEEEVTVLCLFFQPCLYSLVQPWAEQLPLCTQISLRLKPVNSLVQPSQMWAHRVLREQSWLEHLQLPCPYPTGDPAWAKGGSSQLGCLLSSQFHSVPFPVAWPARRAKGLSTYMQKSANLTLLLPNVWKVVYKHVIFTAALYCYKQDSFMM